MRKTSKATLIHNFIDILNAITCVILDANVGVLKLLDGNGQGTNIAHEYRTKRT